MSIRALLVPFACLLLAGCALTHHVPPGAPIGTASPMQYCPNDAVTAQYDVFGDQACAAFSGGGCAALTPPTVTISSIPPSLFPERTFHDMRGALTFTPGGDTVDVLFAVDPRSYGVSYTGTSGTTVVRVLRGNIVTVRKLTGTVPVDQLHAVTCTNGLPTYATTTVAGPAGDSPSLEAQQVCNTGTAPIEVTLTGSSGVSSPPQTLADGACTDVPAGLRAPVMVAVRSLALGPTPRCTPTDASNIPAIQTHVVLACPR